jgi:uncharacterized protein (DUF2249 family)
MTSPRPKTRTLDVRPVFSRGEEPFRVIMTAIGSLEPGEALLLISPFIPAPLIEKLQSEGFSARPERRADGAWQTEFRRPLHE